MAANMVALSGGGGLRGSKHAGVLCLAAWCWWAIAFIWSKCICEMLESDLIFKCSGGTTLNTNDLVLCLRALLIIKKCMVYTQPVFH